MKIKQAQIPLLARRKSFLTFGCIIFVFILHTQIIFACTIFYTKAQTTNYFSSNEDWKFTDPAVLVAPGNNNDYGYIVFGWNSYLPGYPQGGVNEYGICLDWASVPIQSFKADPNRKSLDEDIVYKILKKCRKINEVITLVKQYNCNHFAEEHLLVSDRNGDSCVIEWSGRDYIFLRKTKQYQLITNYNISNPELGWYPCERFKTADNYLNSANGKLTLDNIKELLNKTHQEGDYPTVYSYIVDENSLDIYIFLNHNYSTYTKFNFIQEIKKGCHQIKLSR